MMLDVLLKKIVREKDSWVFSHLRFKQFFAASRTYQEVDVVPGIPFVRSRQNVCVENIHGPVHVYLYTCIRVAPRVEYTLAANSADRSLINRSHYQATSECAWPSPCIATVYEYPDMCARVCVSICLKPLSSEFPSPIEIQPAPTLPFL